MSTNVINDLNRLQLTFEECAQSIAHCGNTNTIIVEGEIGTGKSSLLKRVAEITGYEPRYLDCGLAQDGDVMIPFIENKRMEFIPNTVFLSDTPVVLCLDEVGKTPSRSVQNSLLSLMMEQRIGNYQMCSGSIVFGTTNLITEGVGDSLPAHAINRITKVQMEKSGADTWIDWAVGAEVAPEVCGFAKEFPQIFDSFTRYEDLSTMDNPYIFNPNNPSRAFVSPRSLEKASNIIKKREFLSTDALISNLAGTVGISAARDMQAYIDMADSMVAWESIITDPAKADVPRNPIVCVMLVLRAIQRIERKTMDKWMEYLVRLPREIQFLFITNVVRNTKASAIVVTNKAFTEWCRANKEFA